jgi:hypothetical protein
MDVLEAYGETYLKNCIFVPPYAEIHGADTAIVEILSPEGAFQLDTVWYGYSHMQTRLRPVVLAR